MLLRAVFNTVASASLGTLETKTIAQWHGTGDVRAESRERTVMEAAFEKMLDPISGSLATGKLGSCHQSLCG